MKIRREISNANAPLPQPVSSAVVVQIGSKAGRNHSDRWCLTWKSRRPTAALDRAKLIIQPYGRSRGAVNRTETRRGILRWRIRQLPLPNLDPVAPCAIPLIRLGR